MSPLGKDDALRIPQHSRGPVRRRWWVEQVLHSKPLPPRHTNTLNGIWDRTTFYLCWPHKLHGIGQKMKEDEAPHGPLKLLFASAAIVQGLDNSRKK